MMERPIHPTYARYNLLLSSINKVVCSIVTWGIFWKFKFFIYSYNNRIYSQLFTNIIYTNNY